MSYYDKLSERNQALRNQIFPSSVGGIKVKRVKNLTIAKREARADLSKPAITTGKRAFYSYNPDRHSTIKRGTVGAVYGD